MLAQYTFQIFFGINNYYFSVNVKKYENVKRFPEFLFFSSFRKRNLSLMRGACIFNFIKLVERCSYIVRRISSCSPLFWS